MIIKERIDWDTLQFRQLKGSEKLRCPKCDEQRSNKNDRSLSVSHNSGQAYCHYCESYSIRDFENRTKETKEYKLPLQNWVNHTNLSDKVVKYFAGRGISQKTLIYAKITEEIFYQPAIKKDVNNIVFNYFEGDILINKKYRDAQKNFTQTAKSRNTLYNLNTTIGARELYITEGEIDALSLIEIGIKNVVSIPNGANDNDAHWIHAKPYLEGIQTFYVATDNDAKGDAVAEKIAQRLGRWRCKRVKFTGKDANEDLMSSPMLLEQNLLAAKPYPIGGTIKVNDLKDGIFDLYNNGYPATIAPKGNGLADFARIFSTMKGQLTVWTGMPSHGKSTFLEWLCLNLMVEYQEKISFYTVEHAPYQVHQIGLAMQFFGKQFFKNEGAFYRNCERLSPEELAAYIDWANEKQYYIQQDKDEPSNWDFLFRTMEEQLYAFGIDRFVIDAWNKVEMERGDLLEEKQILTKLTNFTAKHNINIELVAHPKKPQEQSKPKCPDLYSVSGTADFRNQTHNGVAVFRDHGDPQNNVEEFVLVKNLKTKFIWQGDIGANVKFWFDKPTKRYRPAGQTIPNRDPLVDLLGNGKKNEPDWLADTNFQNDVPF